MNRKTYRQLAKKHGMSIGEIKREMQTAIDAAYQNPAPGALDVPRMGDIPTVEEFINYSAKQILKQKSDPFLED